MIICKFEHFIDLDQPKLEKVTHLYLANSNLEQKLEDNAIRLKFTIALQQAVYLKHLNLQFNRLTDDRLRGIHNIIQSYPGLAVNYNDNPGAYAFPTVSQEQILIELFDIIKFLQRELPHIRKFHAFRDPNHPKRAQHGFCDLQTNFTASALVLPNGRAVIIPKQQGYAPQRILNYNAEYKSYARAIKLGFMRSRPSNKLVSCFIKVTSNKEWIDSIENEAQCMARVSTFANTQYRLYILIANSTLNSYKGYFITRSIDTTEAFDLLAHAVGNIHPELALNSREAQANILHALALSLEVMRVHAAGIIHMDIKPENYFYANGNAQLVDYANSLILKDKTSIHSPMLVSTFSYMPPENIAFKSKMYSYEYDDYQVGINLRQILYPRSCTVLGSNRVIFFKPTQYEPQSDENYLRIHFRIGIRASYAHTLSDAVLCLSNPDPRQRIRLTDAFVKMAMEYKSPASKVLKAKYMHLISAINSIFKNHPSARLLVEHAAPQSSFIWEETLKISFNIVDERSIEYALNLIFKLQTLGMYLMESYYGECELSPENTKILQSAISSLFATHKPLAQIGKMYHYDAQIENKIIHQKLRP